MKKAILITFLTLFLAAPALVIHYAMQTSAATMQAENEKQLLHRMQKELQRQDLVVNPIIDVFRRLFMALRRTNNVNWYLKDNEVSDELLSFITMLMRETTRQWFGSESSLLYRQNNHYHQFSMKAGEQVQASELATFLQILHRIQRDRDHEARIEQPKKELEQLIKNKLKLYLNLDIIYEDGDGDRIQRVILREKNAYRLFMILRLRLAFLMNFWVDLTNFNDDEKAQQKIKAWQYDNMGLAFVSNNDSNKVITSSFFNDRTQLLRSFVPLLNNAREPLIRWQNYLLTASNRAPQKPYRTIIAAKTPALQKQPGMRLLTIFLALLSIFIGKLAIENIIFGRGRDFSIMQFILAIFTLTTILPLLSSAYLANEYVAANFKKEKNRAANELDEEMLSLDTETLINFRKMVNFARSLDSVEKMQALTGLPATASINELVLNTVKKSSQLYNRTFFTNVWVYEEAKPFFAVVYDRTLGKYRFPRGHNNPAEEIFTTRYQSYLRQHKRQTSNAKAITPAGDIEYDKLKSELLDNFFLNMFGDTTYYKIRENLGNIIWQESFMDTNAMLAIPVTRNGEKQLILTWIFESAGIRDQFPLHRLRTENQNPLFLIFGNDQYIGARPTALPELTRTFPTLIELGTQAMTSGSRIFMQDYTASGSPLFEARPARHSDFIMCGSRLTRSLESISQELITEALRYFIYIATAGLILALLTSLYFTLPIGRLTRATREISDGKYEVRLNPNHPDEFAIAATAFNQLATGLQQGELLSSFVSESVKKLAAREQLSSEDIAQNATVTVLFSSIRNFETIRQQLDAQKVFDILQTHLSAAVTAIEQYGGEIDKMIDDKVMIVFDNQTQTLSIQAEAAVAVAMAIRESIQAELALSTAAGITTGEVVAGVMGASNVRLARTVVGDTVNLAARLAALATSHSEYSIFAAESTVKLLPERYVCEKLPISRVKGKTRTIEAYSISQKEHS